MTVGKNGYSRNYKLQVHYIWKTAIWRLLLFNDKNNCSMKKLLFCDMKWKKIVYRKQKSCFAEWNQQNVVHGKNGCFVKEALSMSVTNESKRWSRVRINNPQKKRIRELVGFSLIVPFKHKKIHNFTILIYNCSIKHHFTIVYTIFPFIVSFLNDFNQRWNCEMVFDCKTLIMFVC